MRFERKYKIESLSHAELIRIIKENPFCFREVFPKRQINNIYFDTPNFSHFKDNLIGTKYRTKIRLRWYGELFGTIERSQLEYKIRNSSVGTKKTYPIQAFDFSTSINTHTLSEVINRSGTPDLVIDDFKSLIPTLLNSYNRRYFETIDKKIRLTIDNDLSFRRIKKYNNTFVEKYHSDAHIIELKYDIEDDKHAHSVASRFPFRLSKNSKYVTGIEYLFGEQIAV